MVGTLFAAIIMELFSAGAQVFVSVSTFDVLLLLFVIEFVQFRCAE